MYRKKVNEGQSQYTENLMLQSEMQNAKKADTI